MRDVLPQIDAWLAGDEAAERRIAIATVVKVWGSAPRPPGAKMAVNAAGGIAGSVSGGCVEGAVVQEAESVLEGGQPKLVSFGVSDDDAFAVGLPCGGTIEVFVEPLGDEEDAEARLRRRVAESRITGRAVVLGGDAFGRQALLEPGAGADGGAPRLRGSLGAPELDDAARRAAAGAFRDFACRRLELERGDLFVEVHPPPKRLVIVGAVHAAVHLVTLARVAGFETIVVDPRSAFATEERFGHADRLVREWPAEALEDLGVDENTYVALLSHDLKLDVPALEVALPRARYVGALGSSRTHGKRLERLAAAGVDGPIVERIHNPIGLDLGGRRAEEIAVSVLAEIVAVSHGKDYRPPPREEAADA